MPLDLHGFYPNNAPNQSLFKIADTLQDNTRYKQEVDYRNQKEKEAKAQQNRLLNLREIDQDTDLAKFKTGEQRIDDYTQKELASIKNKALTEYVDLDPVEAEYKLSNDMQQLINWHGAVKSNIDKIKEGLSGFQKTYSNTNPQKAHELAYLELANDFLEKDANGSVIRRDPSLVKSRDYISDLNTTEKLSQIVDDVTPFSKYIQSFKPQKSGAKEYTNKNGYAVKHGYTAEVTPFSEIEINEDGKPIGVKLKSEDFNYRDGETLKMLPESQFEQMMQVPEVRASIIGMWAKNKADFESQTGSKITPANEDKMLRGFLYDEIKNNNLDQHFFKPDDAVITPRITINNNTGNRSQDSKIDLTEYPDAPSGGKDITALMQGVDVVSLVTGKKFAAEKIIYNPSTQRITVTDPVSHKPEEMSLTTFIQNAKPQNPASDIKFLQGLRNPITGAKPQQPKDIKNTRVAPKYKGLDKNGNPIFE